MMKNNHSQDARGGGGGGGMLDFALRKCFPMEEGVEGEAASISDAMMS